MTTNTRFAPSPTGSLHIGGIRTALFSWLYAKHNKGKFILRIEDTDQERSTIESTKIILDGMSWLGLVYDEGPYYQSHRFNRYREIVDELLKTGNAYYCYCTKEEVDIMREEAIRKGEKPKYNGFWRDRNQSPPNNVDPVIRFKNPLDGQVIVDDLVQGRVIFDNKELDDLIIARADGSPTYNLTVVVDDMDMEITDVIRGDDHLNNTPRQINILNALGAPLPNYAHLPMILGEDGKKISKRNGVSNIMQYKEDGFLPEALLNYLVRLGWSKNNQEIFSIDEMISEFHLRDVNKSASSINPKKLLWLNQHYLKETDNKSLANMLGTLFDGMNVSTDFGPNLEDLIAVQKKRTGTVKDMAKESIFFYKDFQEYDAKLAEKYLRPNILEVLRSLYDELRAEDNWNNESIKIIIDKLIKKFNIKISKLAQPLRFAVTGTNISPSIDDTLRLLGQEKSLVRLKKAIKYIENHCSS
jgi:glutamyl-tRNA synthetase